MPQAGQEATSTDKPITKCPKNMSEAGHRCVCLNARSIVNTKNELNIMVEDYSARARTSQGRKCIRYSFIITKRISGQCKNT